MSVILGDPGLPDKVKKDGRSNPEDFDTINRMKEAGTAGPNGNLPCGRSAVNVVVKRPFA